MNVWVWASDGNLDAVAQFVAHGGDVNAQDETGYTPLQAAVSYNHVELVQYLLHHGASVELADFDQDTPLHRAETVECAKLLLDNGAELNAHNNEGRTPYDAAIEEDFTELLSMYDSLHAERTLPLQGEETEQGDGEEPMSMTIPVEMLQALQEQPEDPMEE